MEAEQLKAKIRLMGDVMIGRLVNERLRENKPEYIWGNILPILHQPGINIINLEAALTTSYKKVLKVFNFKADPEQALALKTANIHIANLANNHVLDYSYRGLTETLDVLDHAGILHTGAGENLDEARRPAIYSTNMLTVAVIGCTDNEPKWAAQQNRAGTNFLEVGNISSIAGDIAKAKEIADIVIVSIHWGPNMVERPNRVQREFAYRMLEAGADVIHGHSAHIFQGIEIKGNKIILYDTGDFIDDYIIDPELRNDRSFLYELLVTGKKITGLQLTPTTIHEMQVNKSTEHEARWSLARMQMLSEELGTYIPDNGVVELATV